MADPSRFPFPLKTPHHPSSVLCGGPSTRIRDVPRIAGGHGNPTVWKQCCIFRPNEIDMLVPFCGEIHATKTTWKTEDGTGFTRDQGPPRSVPGSATSARSRCAVPRGVRRKLTRSLPSTSWRSSPWPGSSASPRRRRETPRRPTAVGPRRRGARVVGRGGQATHVGSTNAGKRRSDGEKAHGRKKAYKGDPMLGRREVVRRCKDVYKDV